MEPCPREAGHPGHHYWWDVWPHGPSWRVMVFRSVPSPDYVLDRIPLASGRFDHRPDRLDVYELLVEVAQRRRRERQHRKAVHAAMSKCGSCKAEMRWAKTIEGKLIPMDPQPVPDGKFALTPQGGGEPPLAEAAGIHTQLRYDTHFATCPNARSHRKRDGARP